MDGKGFSPVSGKLSNPPVPASGKTGFSVTNGFPSGWGDQLDDSVSVFSSQKSSQPPDGFVPAGERKEAPPVKKEAVFKENVPIVDTALPKELGPEVKDWMERLETGEEVQLPQQVTDDSTGQVIVDTPVPQKVEIKLPLSEPEIQRGLHQEIVDSVRWLAEWCKRLLIIASRKFIYRTARRSET